MKNTNISALLKKADELRALFILGQKVIPFMEEVFVFVSEIQPLLDDINNSISENIKKMPNASKQLTKVTEATELATTEILDLVDGIFFNLDTVASELSTIRDGNESDKQNIANLLEELYNDLDTNNNANIKNRLKKIIDTISEQDNYEAKYNKIAEVIQTIQIDSSSIMISLQVQDITSQQLAAVNKLLETLQVKLESILGHFKDSDLSDLTTSNVEETNYSSSEVSKLHRNIAFDPNAVDSIANRDIRQNEIDEFIKNSKSQNATSEISEPTKQDDIDKYFQQQSTARETSETTNQDDIDKLFAGQSSTNDDSESANQDDIDKLFAQQNNDDNSENLEDATASENNSSDEDSLDAFSQDDIDKLFKKNG